MQVAVIKAQGRARWIFICNHWDCQALIVSSTEQEALAAQEKRRKEHEYLDAL